MRIVPNPRSKLHIKQAWKPSLPQTGTRSEVIRLTAVVVIEPQQQSDRCCLKTPSEAGTARILVLDSTIINGLEQTRLIQLGLKMSLGLLEAMYTNGWQQIPFVRLG
jgi:hypothetical protein